MIRGQAIFSACIVCFLSFLTLPCHASDFSTAIQSSYTLTATNTVDVSHTITITNQSDLRYPTGYSLILHTTDVKNLKITSGTTASVKANLETTNQGTRVAFTVPDPVVGKGKSQTYRLTYQNADMVLGSGLATQLLIPPLGIDDPHASESAIVLFPTHQCPHPVSYPPPVTPTQHDGMGMFSFDQASGLFFRCTDQRYVSVNLNYALENTNMTPIETQITLPPDTNYQQFSFTQIEPKPIALYTDADGNLIATFKLEPKEQKHIAVSADAILSSTANTITVPNATKRTYLTAQPYWPVNDVTIKRKITSSNQSTALLQQLINETGYDWSQANQTARNGGRQLIVKPTHLSGQDYVDSFITLARTAGIMSRRLVGIVPVSSAATRPMAILPHQLHAWADYYDPDSSRWIQVDPTWQKTTFSNSFNPIQDLNHIVLAINGSSDTTPYPAGYYYTAANPSPAITVIDRDPFTFPIPSITAKLESSWLASSKLQLTNTGMVALYNQLATLSDGNTTKTITIDRLPIGGQVIIPINLTRKTNHVNLTIGNQTINVTISSFTAGSQFTVTCALVAVAGFLAVLAGRLLVSRRKR